MKNIRYETVHIIVQHSQKLDETDLQNILHTKGIQSKPWDVFILLSVHPILLFRDADMCKL